MDYKSLRLFASNVMPQTPFIINPYTLGFVGGNFSNETYEIENILGIDNDQIITPDYDAELNIVDIAIPYKFYYVDFYSIGPDNSDFYISIKPYRQEFDVQDTSYFQATMAENTIRVEDFGEYVDDVKEISISLVHQAEKFVIQILLNNNLIKQDDFTAHTILEFYEGVKKVFKDVNYFVDIETNFQYNDLVSYLQSVQGNGLKNIARYEKIKFYEGRLELASDEHDFVPYPILYDVQGLYIQNSSSLSQGEIDRINNSYQYFNFQDRSKYGTSQSKFSIYNIGQHNGFLVKNNLNISHQYIREIIKYGYFKVFTEVEPSIYGLQFHTLSFSDLYLIKPDVNLPTFQYLTLVYDNIIKDQLSSFFENKLIGKRNIDREISLTQEEVDSIPYLTKAEILQYTYIRRTGIVQMDLKMDTILQQHFIDTIEFSIQ